MTHPNHYRRWLDALDDLLVTIVHEGDMEVAASIVTTLRVDLLNCKEYDVSSMQTLIVDKREPAFTPSPEEILPKVQPIPGKRPKSIDVACPTCKARAGKRCFEMTNRGRNGKPTDVVREQGYHSARVVAAKQVFGS